MMIATDPRLDDPDSFVAAVPHETFARLRREAPVFRQECPDGTSFWVLTKYEDIVAVSTDSVNFSSARGTNIEDMQGGTELMMLNMDPPRHTKLRNLVSKGFTPRMVRLLEPHVREIAKQIIDDVAQRGECDFVTDVAAELPLQVIAELIGVPLEERHLLFQWSNQMIGLGDPEYGNDMERPAQETARRPLALPHRRRGDAALGLAGHVLPPHGNARHGGPRPEDSRRREGNDLVRRGKPRRRGVPGGRCVRCRP